MKRYILALVAAISVLGCQTQPQEPSVSRRGLIEEQTISFKTNDGVHYIAAEDGGGKEGEFVGWGFTRRPRGLAVANRTNDGPWERFQVYNCGDGYFSFRSDNGGILSAQPDGTLIFNRERSGEWCPGGWEAFKIQDAGDGKVSLITDHGTRVRAINQGGGELRHDVREHIGVDEMFSLSRPLGGTGPIGPQPGIEPGIVGQLRLEPGGGFYDARGPVLPVFEHCGDCFSRYARGDVEGVRHILRLVKQAGYDGIRFWSTLGDDNPFWDGRGVGPDDPQTPDYWNKLRGFLTMVRDHGLTVHWAQGDLTPGVVRNRQDFAYNSCRVAREVGIEVVALFEGLNEARDTGEPNVDKVAQFVSWFKEGCPEPLTGLSAFTGHEDVELLNRWSRPPADLFIVHSYRGGRWFDKIRHVFTTQYGEPHSPKKRNGWNGEGPGNGVLVSAIDNKHEMNAETYQLLAAMALMAREGYVHFSGPGVISDCAPGEIRGNNPPCNGEKLEDMPGFWEVPRVKQMLPADIMRYDALFHGGRDSRRWYAATDHDTRVDHAWYRDGRTCVNVYGPNPGSARELKRGTITHDTVFGNQGRVFCGQVH